MKLEDIIQLKKTETPTPQDWEKFDGELKRKMLLTIVEKKPAKPKLGLRSILKPVGAASFALALFAFPALFINFKDAAPSAQAVQNAIAEAVEMPSGDKNFAVCELSLASEVSLLSAPLNPTGSSKIQYVTSDLGTSGGISF